RITGGKDDDVPRRVEVGHLACGAWPVPSGSTGSAVMTSPRQPNRRPAPAGAARRNFLKAGGLLAAGTAAAPLVSSCSAAAGDTTPTLNVATVTNSQMVDMQSLTHHFTE